MMKDLVGDNSTINSVYRVNNDYERNRGIKKNRGSAIIEMTLIMPIILGVIYLYICLFLFLLDSGKTMHDMAENLYYIEDNGQTKSETENNVKGSVKNGDKISIYVKKTTGLFDMNLELHRTDDDVVERIRRWQLATDTVRERGIE